jgi:hypothetical protein
MIDPHFLSRIMCGDGPYCLWTARRAVDADGKPTKELVDRRQTFYDDLPDLMAAGAGAFANDREVYFAMASFKDSSTREAANVRALKCFFFDLDCRPGKEYSDKVEALQALRNFCTRNALPKPVLVDSGGGIHGYWVLDREVSYEEWSPVAERYKAACVKQGFRMDMAVPADGARILRLPGTANFKDTPPSPVTTVALDVPTISFEDFASKFEGMAVKPKVFIPAKHRAVTEQLLGNNTNSFRKIITREDTCAQLIYAITNQADASEPMWRATLSIAAHCQDSSKAIHAVSREHPDYDPADTEAKASRIKGPYLCSRFAEARPGGCDGCPHLGHIKSPIVLGRELNISETEEERTVELPVEPARADRGPVKTMTVVVPKPPFPYVRGAAGGVYRQGKDEDGNPKDELVYHHDFYITRRVYDPEVGDKLICRLHLPKDGVREFSVLQSAINSPDKLQSALSTMGITARGKAQWTSIGYYIMDYVDHLQSVAAADLAHRQFGWTDGMKSFVIGEREYIPGGVRHNPPTSETSVVAEYLKPKGDLEHWKELMQFFNHAGMELHQLIICTAFGSPLMEFSPIYSMLIHLDGPTGFGKTTTQWAAAGVYGKPDGLMIRHEDTNASKFARFEIMKNLPVYIDELTKCAPVEASDLAYSLSAGRQRNRMQSGSNAERRRGEPWHLSSVSSGNSSLMDVLEAGKADPAAERERIFEINIKDYIFPHSKEDADTFQHAILKDVYGVAADPYLRWLVDNVEEVRKFYLATQQRLDAAAGLSSKNRMMSAGFAAHLAGGMIAKRLGLIDFDMKRVFDLVVKLIRERTAFLDSNQKTSVDYLVQYVSENYTNILRINSTQDLRGKGDAVEDTFVVPDATPRAEFVARYEPDTKRLFLYPKPFRTWCVKQQLNPTALMENISKDYKYEFKKMRMGKGTKIALPSVAVHIIDLPLEEHLDVDANSPA